MKKITSSKTTSSGSKKVPEVQPSRPEQKEAVNKKIAPPDEETVKRVNQIGAEYIFSAYYKPRKYDLL